jgi:hypothetical protein
MNYFLPTTSFATFLLAPFLVATFFVDPLLALLGGATLLHLIPDNKSVKLLPLSQPPVRARTDALTNPSAHRPTQLRSVLPRVYAV